VKHISRPCSQIISNPKQNKKLKKWERKRSGNTFSTREMIDTDVRGRKMEEKQ
jgi:hypothetical protein